MFVVSVVFLVPVGRSHDLIVTVQPGKDSVHVGSGSVGFISHGGKCVCVCVCVTVHTALLEKHLCRSPQATDRAEFGA